MLPVNRAIGEDKNCVLLRQYRVELRCKTLRNPGLKPVGPLVRGIIKVKVNQVLELIKYLRSWLGFTVQQGEFPV